MKKKAELMYVFYICFIRPPPPQKKKIVSFTRYVEKYGSARQATDDNIIWSMCFAFWITKATDTQNMYFTIATVVTRMDLDVVFIPTLPILFFSCG